jgi:cyclophilin family peptidyl-prolyl cis-trans isomerase
MKRILLYLIPIFIFLFMNACDKEKVEIVKITTEKGEILLWLYDETPVHKENFVKLTKEGFYDGTTFHRVIRGFMIQGGDPNSKDGDPMTDGQGGPGYTLEAEILNQFSHKRGALAAARMGDNVNPDRESSGSQFYIVQGQNGAPHLDGQYTVFGEVISGMDVVDQIAAVNVDGRSRPVEDIKMQVQMVEKKLSDLVEKYEFSVPGRETP